MTIAHYSDKSIVIDILSQSFYDNKSVNYVIKDDKNRLQRIRRLMDYSFEICFLFGKVFLSDDKKGCALILFPEKKKTTLKAIVLDVKFVLTCLGIKNLFKTVGRESKIKKLHPRSPFVHLWFIGVDPSCQNRGTGSYLLKEVIAEADKHQRNVYLETSTDKNISWYEKFKFKIYNEIELGYKLFLLSNKP
jgi:N-acetylglutamate synthase-like GNAT family acetyltransferase